MLGTPELADVLLTDLVKACKLSAQSGLVMGPERAGTCSMLAGVTLLVSRQ